MQKIRIQFSEQPRESHCKNEHSQNGAETAIQYNSDPLSHAQLKNGEKENLVIDAPSTLLF